MLEMILPSKARILCCVCVYNHDTETVKKEDIAEVTTLLHSPCVFIKELYFRKRGNLSTEANH